MNKSIYFITAYYKFINISDVEKTKIFFEKTAKKNNILGLIILAPEGFNSTVAAKNETAMLTTFNEVDMTALMELRSRYNEEYLKRYGVKIGFMSLFAKACSAVLLQMPEVNAQLVGEDLIYHDFTDIYIAISTPNGLVVPPSRNVETLKFDEIELQLKKNEEKARNNK